MKHVLSSAALAMALVVGVTSAAEARQGCGIGAHRGRWGRCVANHPGRFYAGRGWWDGHRYWQHRYRWHGGWRYR